MLCQRISIGPGVRIADSSAIDESSTRTDVGHVLRRLVNVAQHSLILYQHQTRLVNVAQLAHG
jgi:hypothetical protein